MQRHRSRYREITSYATRLNAFRYTQMLSFPLGSRGPVSGRGAQNIPVVSIPAPIRGETMGIEPEVLGGTANMNSCRNDGLMDKDMGTDRFARS